MADRLEQIKARLAKRGGLKPEITTAILARDLEWAVAEIERVRAWARDEHQRGYDLGFYHGVDEAYERQSA